MARTNLPITALTRDGNVLQPAGTTADQANGMNVVLANSGVPHAGSARLLVFQVANTAASPFNFILRAGVNPPAFRKDIGDLTVSITNATTKIVGPFDYARYAQSDGSLNVDFGAGFTGTINAYLLQPEV